MYSHFSTEDGQNLCFFVFYDINLVASQPPNSSSHSPLKWDVWLQCVCRKWWLQPSSGSDWFGLHSDVWVPERDHTSLYQSGHKSGKVKKLGGWLTITVAAAPFISISSSLMALAHSHPPTKQRRTHFYSCHMFHSASYIQLHNISFFRTGSFLYQLTLESNWLWEGKQRVREISVW